MAEQIHLLKLAGTKTNESLIAQLETILARAKAGEIHSMACVLGFTKAQTGFMWAIDDGGNIIELIGQCSLLQRRLVDICEE